MAPIRVYLLTCRRPALLRRALRSLLDQTFTDWVCELHNDAPEDESPAALLRELAPADPRISYHHHPSNWGAIASFNHCFAPVAEPFSALLEDDNWWEPALLERLQAALADQPAAGLAWANMRIWQEGEDGSWSDTGRTIWPPGDGIRTFGAPVLLQAFDALHSNGAMLFRSAAARAAGVPASLPFAIVEVARERAFPFPLVLVPQPLANFALTRQTARSRARAPWVASQLLVGASFLAAVPLSPSAWDELWTRSRQARPPRTTGLILIALAGVRRRELLSRVRPGDLPRFCREFLGSLRANLAGLRFRKTYPDAWTFLLRISKAWAADVPGADRGGLPAGSLFDKHSTGGDDA